jgi:hypothetical protein
MGRGTIVPATLLAGLFGFPAPAAVSDGDLEAFVTKRVRDWRTTPAERRLDEVGWAKNIRSALRLGKEHRRPVFLFTLDGRMGTGRC